MPTSNTLSILDMLVLVQQGLNTVNILVDPDIEPEEIIVELNKAIYKVIDGILDSDVRRQLLDDGFEADQLSLDALTLLHLPDVALTSDVDTTEYKRYSVPTDYYSKTRIDANVTYPCGKTTKTKTSEVRVLKSQRLRELLGHSFAKSQPESLASNMANDKLYVYKPDNTTINNVLLSYIRKPANMVYAVDGGGNFDAGNSVNCELRANAEHLVVDIAIAKLSKISVHPQQKIINLENEK
jgi:hypothetical protein